MSSFVFFGLDGRYSTLLLESLVRAELPPSLVVVGREPRTTRREAEVSLSRAKGSWWRPKRAAVFASGAEAVAGTDLSAQSLAYGIDVLELSDPRALRARARIRERQPSAFVVAGFHRLLPQSMLELAPRGGLNVHPGRLPEERGPSPMFWMLKAGRTRGRVTVHLLDAGEDRGDIVAATPFEISPGMSGSEALERAALAVAPILVANVRALLAGTLVGQPQSHAEAGRCPRPSVKDCRVDPKRSAVEVFTYVAGCAGAYPVYVECGGDRFFIADAVSHDDEANMAFEYMLSGDRLILRCNPGIVELALKPDGALFTAEYEEEPEAAMEHQHG